MRSNDSEIEKVKREFSNLIHPDKLVQADNESTEEQLARIIKNISKAVALINPVLESSPAHNMSPRSKGLEATIEQRNKRIKKLEAMNRHLQDQLDGKVLADEDGIAPVCIHQQLDEDTETHMKPLLAAANKAKGEKAAVLYAIIAALYGRPLDEVARVFQLNEQDLTMSAMAYIKNFRKGNGLRHLM